MLETLAIFLSTLISGIIRAFVFGFFAYYGLKMAIKVMGPIDFSEFIKKK